MLTLIFSSYASMLSMVRYHHRPKLRQKRVVDNILKS